MSFISIVASASASIIGFLSTTWKCFSCLPWFYWVWVYVRTFDLWRFASVWITWALSSVILASVSTRRDSFDELVWHGLIGDKLGKTYFEEFASMMLGDQIRQFAVFALVCAVRGKARAALPPLLSFRDTMSLREADNIFMTFFLGSTGIQVFFMAFDRDYHSSLQIANMWDTSPFTKVTASVSVKSLLYVAGMAGIVLAKKFVIKLLHLANYREGPGPSLKGLILDWYNNNILLRALVQQTGEVILGTLEWMIVQDPMTRARNYSRQLRFRYTLKQARRKATNSQINNPYMIVIQLEGQTCLVCFEDFDIGYKVPWVSCGHLVHAGCWLSILSKGDGKCPHPGCKVRPSMEQILEQSSASDIKEALGIDD